MVLAARALVDPYPPLVVSGVTLEFGETALDPSIPTTTQKDVRAFGHCCNVFLSSQASHYFEQPNTVESMARSKFSIWEIEREVALGAVHILHQPPEGGEGVWQMLTISDEGGRGGKPKADHC